MVHYTAPPITGGVEGVIGQHARLLREAGHDVRIIAGRGDAELVPEADSRHPAVEALYRRLAAGEPDVPGFMGLVEALAAGLAPLLADRQVVIAHNVLTMPFNLPLALALVEAGRPLVAWTHDIAWVNPRYRAFQRPGQPYAVMARPQPGVRYVTVSDVRRRELEHLLGPEAAVETVPNGIDVPAFLGIDPLSRDLLRAAGLEGSDPLLLVPLRVTRRKRLELMIEAAAEIRAQHPRLGVCISGPLGPHNADNVAYAQELLDLRGRLGLDACVRFMYQLAGDAGGHPVGDRTIADLYRLADVAVMPSESEGFGLPALEAATARLPLVCADIEVLREAGGPNLHTFPVAGGPRALAAAVSSALDDPRVVDARTVRTRNGWPAVLPHIERVIESARA